MFTGGSGPEGSGDVSFCRGTMIEESIIRRIMEMDSPEVLLKTAIEEGYPLQEEEALKIWNKFHSSYLLNDDEIDNVAGGCGSETKSNGFTGAWAVGKELLNRCPVCQNNCWAESVAWGNSVRRYECQVCWVRKQYNLPSAPTIVPSISEPGQSSNKPRSEVWVKD